MSIKIQLVLHGSQGYKSSCYHNEVRPGYQIHFTSPRLRLPEPFRWHQGWQLEGLPNCKVVVALITQLIARKDLVVVT